MTCASKMAGQRREVQAERRGRSGSPRRRFQSRAGRCGFIDWRSPSYLRASAPWDRLGAMRRFGLRVAAFALALVPWGLPPQVAAQDVGFVEIRQLPSAALGPAQVFVDGALWPEPLDNLTNLLLELAPGRHALRIIRDVSRPFVLEVMVVGGEVVIVDALLPPATTRARLIHLLPADAPYSIVGLRLGGTTPATLDVPVGEHVFVVDGKRFCFGLVPDSAAYIRIRSGVIDELRGVTECAALPPPPAPYESPGVPGFTPMTVRPTLTNIEEVQRVLMREYPAVLRDAGIGGAPVLWLYIGTDGAVERTQVQETSGFDALDQAAANVASVMRFTPARNGDETVAVWVQIPIRFAVLN
ncbi:MAG: energy transducer TonB [Gemmatimonadetes bacterium]|nr:energy transducer TonB [Gemmatimonadota bacterium]